MSWWNTSNFTSLASKALKNAQKKIDQALDIPEGGEEAQSGGSETTKKEKGDFWGAFGIGDTSSEGSSSPKSSWSFPWGAGVEEKEEVKEKTAEEIKSEVLKAAKERTKAKSKLFPQKNQASEETNIIDYDKAKAIVPSEEKTPEDSKDDHLNAKDGNSKSDQFEISGGFGERLENVDSSDVLEVLSDEQEPSVSKSDVDSVADNIKTDLPDTSIVTKVVQDTVKLEEDKGETPGGSLNDGALVKSEESQVTKDSSTEKNSENVKEAVAQLDVSVTQTVTASLSGSFLSVSMGEQADEPLISTPVGTSKDSSFQELTVDTGGFSGELQSLARSSSGSDLLQISDIKSDFVTDISSEKSQINIKSEETESTRQGSLVAEIKRDEKDHDQMNIEEESKVLSMDVSSSVEIVLEKDIPHVAQGTIQQTSLLSHEQEFKEDKVCATASQEIYQTSQSDLFSVIDKQQMGTSENIGEIEQIRLDNLDILSKEIGQQKRDFQKSESGCPFSESSHIDITPRSESESSINTLDVSQDTCTSEETVIEEELNAASIAENVKENSSKDLQGESFGAIESSNSQLGKESDRTCSDMIDHKTEQESETEEKSKTVDSSVIESQTVCISSKETESLNIHKVDSESTVNIKEEQVSDGSDTGEKAELSPANSFVKCTLEDAMEESKGDDNSDNHSGNEKLSDGSRSIPSGHESADEIDTTTSSDIEIISLPTPNGENRLVSPLDPVPLRIALQKTSWRGSPTHRRSDSSGSSANSRDGHTELSPGRDHVEYADYSRGSYSENRPQEHFDDNNGRSRQSELPALDEEDDNPYHPQRLLKESNKMEESHDVSHDDDSKSYELTTDCEQKLAEMAEVLQAREDKLLQLSKDNCDLVEANSILRNQLKQSEEARESEMTDLNELTAEFTQRLTDAEKRISSAIKEKDQYKKQLQGAQSELAKKAADTSLQKLLDEKEEQIQGLLLEGEKLSKSQLQSNTIIKKLRSKEKDSESSLANQKKKLETQKEELDHLRKVLDSKEELEKKQTESLAQLQAAVTKQEIEMARLKSENEDNQEKTRGLQAALDNSYKELAELHRSSAVMDSKAQEAALSAEMSVREELKLTIEKQQQQHKWDKDALLMQIEDFRMGMARMEKECNRREDLLKQEIADLQKQLQEDEARTQELTQGVSSATRPLLRQIENLQSTYTAQSSTWEKVEKNLSDRLAETQNQLAVAVEKERTANEQLLDLGSKVTSLETQNSRLRQERSQLTAQLEMLKTKVELSEETKQNEAAQIEVLKNQLNQEIVDLKKQKVLLETQLDVEKSKVEQEKKKVNLLQEQIRDLEREAARSRSRGTPSRGTPSPVSISRQESFTSSFHEQPFTAISQEELDRSFYLQSANGSKQSLYEALRQSGAANLLENLQSQLKLREGEIVHLQSEIHNLERTRESMAKELVNLSNSNDDLLEQVEELPVLKDQYKELDQRYNALLQMYGEKVEEANELRLDLQDVKEMYKAQINQLLSSQ